MLQIEKVAVLQDGGHPDAGQDGAFCGDYMFRFDADGTAWAFDARPLCGATAQAPVTLPLLATFHTDLADAVTPHFNAVTFGSEYYEPEDEFPLLYTNLYNNYAGEADRREGVCCVYRLQKIQDSFSMTLVQVIRIGFTKDDFLWCSGGGVKDVRPYGNFVVDRDQNLLYVYTMRDAAQKARYFAFGLPLVDDGEDSEEYGVPVVTLTEETILDCFDTEYHNYIQGGCCSGGLIWSSEGFDHDPPPVLRVIDPLARQQVEMADLAQLGFPREAEFVDFYGEECYYSDASGAVYRVLLDMEREN